MNIKEIVCSKIQELIKAGDIENGMAIEDVNSETLLDELGVNSISYIKIVVALEEQFEIEFDEDDLEFGMIKSIGDLIKIVEKYK